MLLAAASRAAAHAARARDPLLLLRLLTRWRPAAGLKKRLPRYDEPSLLADTLAALLSATGKGGGCRARGGAGAGVFRRGGDDGAKFAQDQVRQE